MGDHVAAAKLNNNQLVVMFMIIVAINYDKYVTIEMIQLLDIHLICFDVFVLFAKLRICRLYPLQKGKKPPQKKKGCPMYDTKLYLMVRFWRSCEFGVSFHYHYSQVHSDLDW